MVTGGEMEKRKECETRKRKNTLKRDASGIIRSWENLDSLESKKYGKMILEGLPNRAGWL